MLPALPLLLCFGFAVPLLQFPLPRRGDPDHLRALTSARPGLLGPHACPAHTSFCDPCRVAPRKQWHLSSHARRSARLGLDGRLGVNDRANRGDKPGDMGSSLRAVALPPGTIATAITSSSWHNCALVMAAREDDPSATRVQQVMCWGDSSLGQMGRGDTRDRGDSATSPIRPVDFGTGLTPVLVAAGGQHTCAILVAASTGAAGGGGTPQRLVKW